MKEGYTEVGIAAFWNIAKEFYKQADIHQTEEDDPSVSFSGVIHNDLGTFYCKVTYIVKLGATIPDMKLYKKNETEITKAD